MFVSDEIKKLRKNLKEVKKEIEKAETKEREISLEIGSDLYPLPWVAEYGSGFFNILDADREIVIEFDSTKHDCERVVNCIIERINKGIYYKSEFEKADKKVKEQEVLLKKVLSDFSEEELERIDNKGIDLSVYLDEKGNVISPEEGE